jgi:hypothetical protein
MIVALCCWITDSIVWSLMLGLSTRIFSVLICVIITMGIGGAISIVFVKEFKGSY